VVLGTARTSAVSVLVVALSDVIAALGRPCVLVGGVAVAARLGRVERATGDVDAVIDAPEGLASAEILIRAGAAEQKLSSSSVMVHGVKVDLIDTFSVPRDVFDGASGASALFAAPHRFGFETASELRLVVHDGPQVVASVAEPRGLVAMKFACCTMAPRAREAPE
jgi:hypothetical protein